MNGETVKALTMMAVALPTMFAVIAVFMMATTALHKAFPAPPEEEGEEEEEDED
jgi:H+/gluconate symporter-like permease